MGQRPLPRAGCATVPLASSNREVSLSPAADPGTKLVMAERCNPLGLPTPHRFCLAHGTSVCAYVGRGQSTPTLVPVRVCTHPTNVPGPEEA